MLSKCCHKGWPWNKVWESDSQTGHSNKFICFSIYLLIRFNISIIRYLSFSHKTFYTLAWDVAINIMHLLSLSFLSRIRMIGSIFFKMVSILFNIVSHRKDGSSRKFYYSVTSLNSLVRQWIINRMVSRLIFQQIKIF